ncbi:alpha/beta fold hydrolase [Marinoscillum pacificum]|uniref:alpha/beta fold hydrolase n=1 Tax=Marinoscillum pacificum TaxID=392723 RepID=UPI002158101D|nr:alpha/beta hydrolase [Marinoscillum pacificum]
MKRFFYLTILIVFAHLGFAQSKAYEVKVSGKGQAIIFLPGFTCPGEVWDNTISNLEPTYQTHQFTYAGFGDVPAIELPWYGTLADEIANYIETKKLKNVIIIGHSMGGMLAIDLAAKLPKQISKMVLVDALPNIKEIVMPQVPVEQISFDNPYNQQMMAASDSALAVTAGYMAMGMSNQTDRHQELINYILQSDRKTYVYGYTELLKLDLRDKLANIKAETLVLGADFPSKEVTLPNFESQFSQLENKEIKIASGSKHFIMFDQPEWFYQEVNNFLD